MKEQPLDDKIPQEYEYNNHEDYNKVPFLTVAPDVTSTEGCTIGVPLASTVSHADSSPPEVQSNSVPLGVEPSSNYLPVNGNATPRDRGGVNPEDRRCSTPKNIDVYPEEQDLPGETESVNPEEQTMLTPKNIDVYPEEQDLPGETESVNPEEQTMLTPKNIDVQPLRTGILPGGTKDVNPEEQTSLPPEVQSNSVPLGVEPSSNYLSLKSNATPGDRGEESETIDGSRGELNREAATASGKESRIVTSSGLPVADLREAKGQLNRRADGRTTSGGADGRNVTSDVSSIEEGSDCTSDGIPTVEDVDYFSSSVEYVDVYDDYSDEEIDVNSELYKSSSSSLNSLYFKSYDMEINSIYNILDRYKKRDEYLMNKLIDIDDIEIEEYKIIDDEDDVWCINNESFDELLNEYLEILFINKSTNKEYINDNEMIDIIEYINNYNDNDIIIDKYDIIINKNILYCLNDYNWINDEIINFI